MNIHLNKEGSLWRLVLLLLLLMIVAVPGVYGDMKDNAAVQKIEMNGLFETGIKMESGKYAGVEIMDKESFWSSVKSYGDFFFKRENRVPAKQIPQVPLSIQELTQIGRDGLAVSWLGHSSLLICIKGRTILTDPVFFPKVTFAGPKKFTAENPFKMHDIKHIDAVLISHDHYDHLSKKTIIWLQDKTEKFYVPKGVGRHLEKWGVSREKIVEMRWWEEALFGDDLRFAALPTQHFSGRTLWDRNTTLWCSWAIITVENRLYFSGDSGYFKGFKEIGEKYGPFDVTFMECGAYNKRWPDIHMFPEQTVQAHLDLRGKIVQPVHWGTFNLSFHAWYEPMERFSKEARRKGVAYATPVIGKIVDYTSPIATDHWWEKLISDDGEKVRPLL